MLLKPEDFETLVSPLRNKKISHAWKGYGDTIFLELGNLVPGKRHSRGEACISLQNGWRIEDNTHIVGGSSESGGKIEDLLRGLIGSELTAIEISKSPFELCASLGDNKKIRSMAAVSGDPQWAVKLTDGRWLSSVSGALDVDDGSSRDSMAPLECAAAEHAKETASRWGRPMPGKMTGAGRAGACRDCRSFVRLDANFELLDFGACTNARSPMDGRVTNVRCGCNEFTAE